MEPENEGVHFGERNGIHIIDLQKTLKMFREASRFVSELPGKAGPFCSWAPNARRRKRSPKSQTLRCVFREPPVAGRHADELGDAAEIHQAAEAAEGHERRCRIKELSKKEQARLDREMKHLFRISKASRT